MRRSRALRRLPWSNSSGMYRITEYIKSSVHYVPQVHTPQGLRTQKRSSNECGWVQVEDCCKSASIQPHFTFRTAPPYQSCTRRIARRDMVDWSVPMNPMPDDWNTASSMGGYLHTSKRMRREAMMMMTWEDGVRRTISLDARQSVQWYD